MRAVRCWSLGVAAAVMSTAASIVLSDPLPPSATYRPLPSLPLSAVMANDEAEKPRVTQDQQTVLPPRYATPSPPIPRVLTSSSRKQVHGGVLVKLPADIRRAMKT